VNAHYLQLVVVTQLTEYPVNLGTRVFFEPANPVLLNPVFISVYPVLPELAQLYTLVIHFQNMKTLTICHSLMDLLSLT